MYHYGNLFFYILLRSNSQYNMYIIEFVLWFPIKHWMFSILDQPTFILRFRRYSETHYVLASRHSTIGTSRTFPAEIGKIPNPAGKSREVAFDTWRWHVVIPHRVNTDHGLQCIKQNQISICQTPTRTLWLDGTNLWACCSSRFDVWIA